MPVKPEQGRVGLILARPLILAIVLIGLSGAGAAAQSGTAVVPANRWPAKPAQPIAFSHKVHAARKVQCQTCHPNPAPGDHMTVAATGACMKCHASIAKDKPEIKKLAQFDSSKKPVPWARVYAVRTGVEWSHKKHLDAKFACEDCHGQVSEMDTVAEVTSVVTKVGCLNCHEAKIGVKAKQACTSCHKWYVDPKVPVQK